MTCVAVVVAMVAAGCGDGDDSGPDPDSAAGTPVAGGRLVYGLEAETTDGWCLPEAQLAISGITVANALYDTLTRPNAAGEVEPWLAETVEPNEDSTQWTITLREGVVFHDGTELTADVVKNNLDAYRGQYPPREPLLFTFLFQPIESVDVVDPRTVEVTLNQPWVAFDDALWGNGRIGILAQSQLDDTSSCAEAPVGTGPFSLVNWTPNQSLVAERNPEYWATDAAGDQLPYLDEVEFRPIVENSQRVNALESGEIDAMHTSDSGTIEDARDQADSGELNAYITDDFSDVTYMLLNVSEAPFDNLVARQALAYALDFEEYNAILGEGALPRAVGPFSPGNVGYLEDSGFPSYDPDEAARLVSQYEEETGEELTAYTAVNSEATLQQAQLLQQQMEAVGIGMEISSVDQSSQIDIAIGGQFQALQWRNHPGSDPDQQYIWWRTGSPLNFGRMSDPEIDRLLDEGRTSPEGRAELYEDLNRVFGEQIYGIWLNHTRWMVATGTGVNGVPGEGPSAAEGFPGLASGHLVGYMWIEQ